MTKGEMDSIRLFPRLRRDQQTPRLVIKVVALLCKYVIERETSVNSGKSIPGKAESSRRKE